MGLPSDQRRLERALEKIDAQEQKLSEAERDFARLARELGLAASARVFGWSRQRLESKLKTIEARAMRENHVDG